MRQVMHQHFQEFIKTQFAPLEIHQLVATFLESISSEFKTYEVIDEGEYFETKDISLLESHRNRS